MADLGTYGHSVDIDIDIEDVLDEVSTEELEEYLAERKAEEKNGYSDDGARNTIIGLCMGKVRRNMENDKEEVKAAINEIIDELF